MAQTVKVNLAVPYHFPAALEKQLRDYEGRCVAAEAAAKKSGGPAGFVRTYDEQLRDLSEEIITAAMANVYGDSMPRTERGLWRPLQQQLIAGAHVLEMDGSAFEWLKKTVTSDKVKVHPADVDKYETFIESLEHVERAEG